MKMHYSLVLILAACGTETAPLATGPVLVAALACPESAVVGVPFELDGTASIGTPAEISLQVAPGPAAVTDSLASSFTVTAPGTATASLTLVDAAGVKSEARCRFPVTGDAVEVPVVGDEPVDLTGSFAMLAYDRAEMKNGALNPARQCAASPQLSLVELVHEGTSVTMTSKICQLSLPNAKVHSIIAFPMFLPELQESTAPPALIAALPTMGPYTFDIGAAAPGSVFAPPLAQIGAPLIAGAVLTDPTGPLPLEGAGNLVDADGDGEDGVTIQSTAGIQPVAYRRTVRAFSGVVRSADVIEGAEEGSYHVATESSLLTIGSSFMPEVTGLPSNFRMQRIANATCEDVIAQQAALEAALPALPNPAGCPTF